MPASKTANYIQWKGYDAAAAITRYRAVKFSAAEQVTPVTAITDVIAGVAQFDVAAGEITKGKGASVAVEGDTLMEAAGAIAIGVRVCLNADGRALTFTTGNRIIGRCIEAASGAGDYCRVHLEPNGDVAGTA
jgi:hypothetical protein